MRETKPLHKLNSEILFSCVTWWELVMHTIYKWLCFVCKRVTNSNCTRSGLYAGLVAHITQQSSVHVCTSIISDAYFANFVHCVASITHGFTTVCRKLKTIVCAMCNPYSFKFNRRDILLLYEYKSENSLTNTFDKKKLTQCASNTALDLTGGIFAPLQI